MALFKVYHLTSPDELEAEYKSGNSYVIANENEKLAQWKIDVGNTDQDRYGIASEGLIDPNNNSIYRVDDLRSHVYYFNLLKNNWSQEKQDGYYTLSIQADDINYNIPPLISYVDVSTRNEYNKIDHAIIAKDESVADSHTFLTFYAKEIPNDFRVVVCDYR